jgi:alkylation response protein AidB-like acyl-CoA dehydrogenase
MYEAPVGEIGFALKAVAGLGQVLGKGCFVELSEDVVEAVLTEAGRFCTEEMVPLAAVGDQKGAVFKDGRVTTPPGWKELYRRWCEGGWNAVAGPAEFGGQDLPAMVATAVLEIWNSASMGFAVGPTLTFGAVEALQKHASTGLQAKYLAKLVSGEWMGTMNLTEPQAGSDLGALRTRAEPAGDGTYRIFGQKIFITYGEHDFTGNIVHLVLARLPDAPAGTRGISLFLVPKFLVDDEGKIGARNDVVCASIEHKLGIHASPTCTMIYGDGSVEGKEPGAVGWLVGEENKGLACMFTMMNNARLAVGIQGVAVAEAAYQKARAYATERRQGKAPGNNTAGKTDGMSPIIAHPDVKRTLLTMKALTGAARAIAYSCAQAIDMGRVTEGDDKRRWEERAGLLTPVAKAFSTDVGVEVASLGIQVHGGMGFIEETGAARFYRDARIAPIYEGTNGIQAIDLVTRKLPLSGGEHVTGYIGELQSDVETLRESNLPGFGETADRLASALADLDLATRFLQQAQADGRMEEALAGATPYLRLFGLAAGGTLLARGALATGETRPVALCRFFAENLVGECAALRDRVVSGWASIEAAEAALA